MHRGRPWTPADRTGGPVDDVYECIQLDTRDGGQPPFLIENGGRYETVETAEASSIIRSWLEQSRPPASPT
jgi:hypothetical protein